jgi:hypothetical protein
MGDIVLEFSSRQEPIIHFSGPIQIKGLLSTPIPVGKPGKAPIAPSIAAIYIACSAIPKEYCTGGTVHIVLGDGAEVLPPTEKDQVGESYASISKDRRAAGWLADYGNCCASYSLSLELVICEPGRPLQRFQGDDRGICNWQSLAGGRQVAFYQAEAYGPGDPHCELRDVETGRLTSKWDGEITQKSPI